MKSWDCFDTLVARRYVSPHSVFDIVGEKLGQPDFLSRRVEAERASNGTYDDIYRQLPDIDPQIELDTELEQCYGIQENIAQVEDGDIIVSDMYLPKEFILKLLRHCGLSQDVEVYVTYGGKHLGTIWKTLPKIDLHIGDNTHSDVNSPREHGIPARHYTGALFNSVEQYVVASDHNLACWMRYVRLNCPFYQEDDSRRMYWHDQSNYNLPVLALSVLDLPDKPITFNYRDSVWFHPLYEAMTGRTAESVTTSRRCYRNPSPEYIEHVVSKTEGRVLVDLQGSGGSVTEFFKFVGKPMPEVIYVCGPVCYPVKRISVSVSDAIERHNFSRMGTLMDWNEKGPVYAECEHDPTLVEVQSSAMELAIKSAQWFRPNKNRLLLERLIFDMSRDYTARHADMHTEHV